MSRRQTRLSVAVVLLFTACAFPARSARAATAEEAEADTLIAQGVDLREHGKDDEALAVFKRALARSPSPRARAQVALAEQALGLWVTAESDLMLALGAADDGWISKNRGALEGALATVRRRLGSLEVRGNDGAEVMLDGVRLGVLPVVKPFRVEAGRRTLEIRAKGFHPTTRSIEVPSGGVARETVTLVALTAEAAPAVVPRPPGALDTEPDPGRNQRLLGWGFTAVGGAAIATGVVGLVVRNGITSDYNASECPGLGVNQSADCMNKIDATKTWLTVSLITLIGGGIVAVGGFTLVATAPRREPAKASGAPRFGCAPGALSGGASVGCTGSF